MEQDDTKTQNPVVWIIGLWAQLTQLNQVKSFVTEIGNCGG